MPSTIATVVFAMLMIGLFVLDRDRTHRASMALWVPVVWISLAGSRSVSQWFGVASRAVEAGQALEGDPLDRSIQAALIVLGLSVLYVRGRQVQAVLWANAPILIFYAY